MELELRVLSEPPVPHDGGIFQTHRIGAYRGDACVGYLDVTCVQETTNPRHLQNPLLFDRAGNSRMYQTSFEITTPRYSSTSLVKLESTVDQEAFYREVCDIGIALVREAQTFCKTSFDQNMVAFDGLQTPTGQLVWNALLHGYDKRGFVIKIPACGNSELVSYCPRN